MKIIESRDAFYPAFHLGDEPRSVACTLLIMESGTGQRFLKTPFAMLNAYGDDIERELLPNSLTGRPRYYAEKEACDAYLAAEYPHWQRASPIMEALMSARKHYSTEFGHHRVCDKLGLSIHTQEIFMLARGHRSCHQINKYLRLLKKENEHAT